MSSWGPWRSSWLCVETLPREVCLDPRVLYNFTAPRFGVELPVIRDALEILIEEDRYQPFMSDRKAGDENLSDIKVDRLHMMSDMNEEDDITSDTNRDEEAPPEPRPVI